MDNQNANTVIEFFETLKDLKNQGKINGVDLEWDEENNRINIKHVAIKDIKTIASTLDLKPISAEIITK